MDKHTGKTDGLQLRMTRLRMKMLSNLFLQAEASAYADARGKRSWSSNLNGLAASGAAGHPTLFDFYSSHVLNIDDLRNGEGDAQPETVTHYVYASNDGSGHYELRWYNEKQEIYSKTSVQESLWAQLFPGIHDARDVEGMIILIANMELLMDQFGGSRITTAYETARRLTKRWLSLAEAEGIPLTEMDGFQEKELLRWLGADTGTFSVLACLVRFIGGP